MSATSTAALANRTRTLGSGALLAVLALLSACASLPPAGPPPAARLQPRVDILDYEIRVALDHHAGHVAGSVAITFSAPPDRAARSLLLDAVELEIHGACDSQGRQLAVDENPWTLEIYLAEPLPPGQSELVIIDYEAYPRRGIYVMPPVATDADTGWQVWTMGQPEEARHWMPVWDRPNDLATHTLALTVDEDFVTMGSGELIDSQLLRRAGRRTDTWRMSVPHASYLITFVAGEFARADLRDNAVAGNADDTASDEAPPLPVLAEPAELDTALANLSATAEVLDFLGEYTGRPYPFPKYAQSFVRHFTAGGMENISATTLYDEGLHPSSDEPQIDLTGLLVHEAAHQWFGDLLVCHDWSELWLNEGFADYAEALWVEHTEGPAAMAALMQEKQRAYLALDDATRHPTIWRDYSDPFDTFDAHVYEGAGARLHLLRNQLGAENFDACVRQYVASNAGRAVSTADLLAAFHAVIPDYDFTPNFQEWFHETGHPRINTVVREARGDDADPTLVMTQTQGSDGWRSVFHVRVRVAWSRGGQETSSTVWFDEPREQLELIGSGRLDWVAFDADGVLPAEIRREQSADMWAHQLATASEPLLRLHAAQWFAGDDMLRPAGAPEPELVGTVLDALLLAADEDSFLPVRLAALQALAPVDDPRAERLSRQLLADADPRLREGALRALDRWLDSDDLELLNTLATDANSAVAAQAWWSLGRINAPDILARLERAVQRTDDVRLASNLVQQIALTDLHAALRFVLGSARHHPERRVRATAIAALADYAGPLDEVVHRRLCEALHDPADSVRSAAATALAQRGDPRALTHLTARRELEGDTVVLAALSAALLELR
ncbi:MAG: aminopeptidase [Planctomycetota bacterium]|nr:MAG: aminopeptidase [Planctomycetota bacterium]